MNPDQIIVVLVEPAFGGNLGSVCRAMANMGVSELRLVGGVSPNDSDARRMAVSARYLLDQAQVVPDIQTAIAECSLVIGSTARPRKHLGESASLWDLSSVLSDLGPQEKIALVFGRERIGLTNEELACCNHQITIPTFGDYKSLNLSQAALLLLYECSKNFAPPTAPPQDELADSHSIEGLKTHLFTVLEQIGYLRYEGRDSLWQSFTHLLNRFTLHKRDIGLIRGVLNRIQITLGSKPPRTPPPK